MVTKTRVRGVLKGPFSKLLNSRGAFVLDTNILRRLGLAAVKAVVAEAKKDFAKQGKSPHHKGQPEGLPDSHGDTIRPGFFDSFSFRIRGESTIEVVSTWPWIKGITEGVDAFSMRKHTQSNPKLTGKPIPLLQGNGEVIFRMAPLSTGKLWVHPGIAKHTFIERGVRKARERMAEIIAAEITRRLSRKSGD